MIRQMESPTISSRIPQPRRCRVVERWCPRTKEGSNLRGPAGYPRVYCCGVSLGVKKHDDNLIILNIYIYMYNIV